jgi:PAS domain S-box-containing protein
VFTDANTSGNPIIFANDSFRRLTGYSREEVLAQDFNFMMDGSEKCVSLAQIEIVCADSDHKGLEFRCRHKEGSFFWATIFINPVKDKNARVIEHFASFIDCTERKQEIERLHFLLNELNHRTQNTLATVLAIARQTLRGVVSQEVVGAFEGRILALSKAHKLLGRKNWDRLSLHDVIGQILQPFGFADDRATRFSVKGSDVRLQPKAALSFAMLFHELATNAVKHGSLSNACGRVDIASQVETTAEGDRLQLRWRESGGPTVRPRVRAGFGSRLIESGLARELDGEVSLDYEPAGVFCQIAMPLQRGLHP